MKLVKIINVLESEIGKLFRDIFKAKSIRYGLNLFLFHVLWETRWGKSILRKLNNLNLFYPVFIEVEVTTRCNLRCIICEHTYWNELPKDMTFYEFKKIIDQFPILCWIGLTGIGESFLNKDFLKMLEYVKKEKQSFIELYDTFYFIDEDKANRLIELKVDRILVSLDAAKKETYEKIRCGSDFEKVIKNVRYLFKRKMETKSEFPKIDFHFIINKLNYNEIPEFIELVDDLKGNCKTEIQFTRMLHNFPEISDLFMEVPEDIIKKAEEIAKRKKINLIWNQNVPIVKPPIQECTAWSMPFIFVNGDVICCCASNEANKREFQKKYSFGNVFKNSFKSIWFSEGYKKFRKKITQGKTPIQCIDCPIFEIRGKHDTY